MKIEYADNDRKIYGIEIKFNEKDIKDIVNKIKLSNTVNYG